MVHKQVDQTGMARMNDLKQINNSQDKKRVKKEKKETKKNEKLDRKKSQIVKDTKKSEKIYDYKDDNDLANARAISSFSKGHSSYTLR